MSVILVALVCLVIAMPVQAAVSYSQQCDTTWTWDWRGLTSEQDYDGNEWDPESNSSQCEGFWAHMDDINISLEIFLINDDPAQRTLDFEYWVMVSTSAPGGLGFKITEEASYSTDQQYENIVPVDFQESDDRDLYIEVYNVRYETLVDLLITVIVLDGDLILDYWVLHYFWVNVM